MITCCRFFVARVLCALSPSPSFPNFQRPCFRNTVPNSRSSPSSPTNHPTFSFALSGFLYHTERKKEKKPFFYMCLSQTPPAHLLDSSPILPRSIIIHHTIIVVVVIIVSSSSIFPYSLFSPLAIPHVPKAISPNSFLSLACVSGSTHKHTHAHSHFGSFSFPPFSSSSRCRCFPEWRTGTEEIDLRFHTIISGPTSQSTPTSFSTDRGRLACKTLLVLSGVSKSYTDTCTLVYAKSRPFLLFILFSPSPFSSLPPPQSSPSPSPCSVLHLKVS